MTLEEVVEPVANSLTSSSPSLVSFTAVWSTNNIDQSFTTTPDWSSWVWNTAGVQYMEAQSFTATKSKLTWVYVYKQANTGTPTWNFKIDIRTDNAWVPSATILATYTIPLATYNALSVWEFLVNVPYNLTTGTVYHIVCSNTATEWLNNSFKVGAKWAWGYTWWIMNYSADWGATWLPNGTADMYFKTLYYKPTTNFKASQNNTSISISADEDGFNDWAILNIANWTYTDAKNFGTSYTWYLSIYQYSLANWIAGSAVNYIRFDNANEYMTLKFQAPTGFTFWDIAFWTKTASWGSAWRPQYIDYSYNNSTWTNLSTVNTASTTVETTFTIPWGNNTVYVRYLNGTLINANFVYYYNFVSSINLSSLSTLRNYPTNKDIIKQYSTTLGSATTSATYRATKWGFPAIEYSATEYQFLDVDTTATGSTVAFSELWASYTTVADWASLAITSTSTPNIFVKANITANRLLISSNDLNASSDKDWSLRQSVVYQVIQ